MSWDKDTPRGQQAEGGPDSPSANGASARFAAWPWAILLAVGLGGWIVRALTDDGRAEAWRALLVNFAYFTPLAAGMVVWPAVVTAARGQWMGSTRRVALSGLAFAPVSLLALAALWWAAEYWAPWLHMRDLHNAAWLNGPFLFGRDLAGLLVLWLLAAWFVRRCSRGRPSKALAGWLVFAYCIVVSLLGFDLIMALDPHWFSSLFGGYYLVSGMYAAVAAWTLLVIVWQPDVGPRRRHDLGKLIVAFSLLTTYTMFSQLIVIWYENLPEEVSFVIPRMRLDRWGWLSAVLLAVIYLGPLVYLLTVWAKKSRAYLAVAAAAVLVGAWVERWWLVSVTLAKEHQPAHAAAVAASAMPAGHSQALIGPADAFAAAAMLAALVLGARWALARMPVDAPPAPQEAPSA